MKSGVKLLCVELSFRKAVFSTFVVNAIVFVDKFIRKMKLFETKFIKRKSEVPVFQRWKE